MNKILFVLVVCSLVFSGCKKKGCTDPAALNYDSKAKQEDGSCEFATNVLPTNSNFATLTTASATNVTTNSATLGGNITANGGSTVTQRGVCYGTSTNPTTANSTTNDGSGTGSFVSNPTGLTPNTTYYVRAYATNSAGTAYGDEVSFTTAGDLAILTTTGASNVTCTSASVGGTITFSGISSVTQRGVCYGTSTSPTTSNSTTNDGSGAGSFSSNLTGLTAGTTYYVRAYATNSAGTAYGNEVSFTTAAGGGGGGSYPTGSVFCACGATAIVDVTNPTTGKIWMDRNLGAMQAATSSTDVDAYGDLYQWGRFSDGHQCRTSAHTTPSTGNLSSTDQPAHGDFILGAYNPEDWRSPQNDNLWQGVNGVNNPCPSGYRLPTDAELDAARVSWSIGDAAGAIASPLKLPMAGARAGQNGDLYGVGNFVSYWSSTAHLGLNGSATLNYSGVFTFDSSVAYMYDSNRADGHSVRCIKN
jgi:uncharacterized protein (TIGR02145 family)